VHARQTQSTYTTAHHGKQYLELGLKTLVVFTILHQSVLLRAYRSSDPIYSVTTAQSTGMKECITGELHDHDQDVLSAYTSKFQTRQSPVVASNRSSGCSDGV